jgi:hypothetical protein
MNKIIIEVFAANPRLSDEEPDLIEREDTSDVTANHLFADGWVPWEPEDMIDIRRIIAKLDPKQQFVLEAFLDGLSYNDVSVSEKYWRYHFANAIEIIKKELGV